MGAALGVDIPNSNRAFNEALVALVVESDHVTSLGTPNMAAFARAAGISYETLRKVMAGERHPPADMLERCARELGVSPSYFLEYRLAEAQRMFDPDQVGPEAALENLRLWAAAEQERRAMARRPRRKKRT